MEAENSTLWFIIAGNPKKKLFETSSRNSVCSILPSSKMVCRLDLQDSIK
uniref:Alternative protein C15orf17 n=1 Tax=Homo sapiens TaxID=9606 RepID=L8EB19_HUMAN|nr:alternative protein C15orf17 [Homo sapiens]